MYKKNDEKKSESGELMLESLIVYSVTIFLLFLMLAIFSVMYQVWNVQIIANETATRAAQSYKYMDADIVTGYVTKEQLLSGSEYRYVLGNTDLETSAANKIRAYAGNRLLKTTYTKRVGEPVITMEVVSDAFARRHIEVTIQGDYTVPFGEALSYFGFDSILHYETVAYAECLDLLDYIQTVDYADNLLSLEWLDSDLLGFIDDILGLFQDIGDLFAN